MSKTRLFSLVVIIFFSILATACQFPGTTSTSNQAYRKNTLTVWSFFPNKDMDILVRNYEAVHPETKVIHTGYAFSALSSAFWERASQGLGPDAVILTERDLPSLIDAGLIENLDRHEPDISGFRSKSLVSLRGLDGHLYGIPVAFQTMALCYNRKQVDKPPDTLSNWLEQGRNGAGIAIESGFLKSMWGIGVFGGRFFNSTGEFTLQQHTLVNWLTWLQQAKRIPTVYFDHRPEILYDLFATGRVAYFPCWTFEFIPLKEQLGDDLAVAPLPGTDSGRPSPYVETDAFILNVHATAKQKQLALEFAEFMAQPDQQLTFISGQEHTVTPISLKTIVDERLLPRVHVFAESTETAIAFPISDVYRLDRLRFYGDQLYTRVTQGTVSPFEGVRQFFDQINTLSPQEDIVVSTSAASDEVQKAVLVDVQPGAEYLLKLLRIQFEALKRSVVLLQLLLVAAVLVSTWLLARFLNRWLKTLFN
ncbi:MAG: extracellular solute-binding protein [Leptolyngbya sp. SIO3F4]|nr:extracellular solute-binding protein [Leptolyngbya sp. SIO3F4]